jgi:alkanesulfonate monooxygenase SsuD/methylene tetrahydromethanopterin reductase-like flavin-dependent oxidoreductase (luciferase family)
VQNPIDIAEQIAMIDVISGGRLIAGFPVGTPMDTCFAYGQNPSMLRERYQETHDLVLRAWTEQDTFAFNGRFNQQRYVNIWPRPIQKPHPPIWIGATNDTAIRRAARMGDTWILTTHASFPTLARQLEIYKAALKDAGKPFPKELARVPELYVAESDEAAFRECREYIVTKYKAYVAWGQERDVPKEERLDVPFEELARDRFLIGGPERIIQEIERGHRELGINHWLFRVQWPGMPQKLVLKTMRILGEQVLPYFHKRYPQEWGCGDEQRCRRPLRVPEREVCSGRRGDGLGIRPQLRLRRWRFRGYRGRERRDLQARRARGPALSVGRVPPDCHPDVQGRDAEGHHRGGQAERSAKRVRPAARQPRRRAARSRARGRARAAHGRRHAAAPTAQGSEELPGGGSRDPPNPPGASILESRATTTSTTYSGSSSRSMPARMLASSSMLDGFVSSAAARTSSR